MTSFEDFLDTWQTLGDIATTRNPTGVEGTHGQLGTRFPDGLSGNGTHCFADFHFRTSR